MDIKFQRIINGKTRRERITNTTFVEVTFQNLLTEFEEKWLQWLNQVQNRHKRYWERYWNEHLKGNRPIIWAKKVQSGARGHQVESKEFVRKWKEQTVVT